MADELPSRKVYGAENHDKQAIPQRDQLFPPRSAPSSHRQRQIFWCYPQRRPSMGEAHPSNSFQGLTYTWFLQAQLQGLQQTGPCNYIQVHGVINNGVCFHILGSIQDRICQLAAWIRSNVVQHTVLAITTRNGPQDVSQQWLAH